MNTWNVILNPRRSGHLDETVRVAFEKRDHTPNIITPDGLGDLSDALAGLWQAGARRFAIVGGDGSLNAVLNGLPLEEDVPVLGLLPAGTGSDFARMFGVPDEIEPAVDRLLGGRPYRSDVGVIEGAWGRRAFANVGEAGIGAAAVSLAERLPQRLGAVKYPLSFWLSLPRAREREIVLTTAKRTYQGPAMAVIFANGQFFGGGLNIAPRAAVTDGELDLQIFAARRIQALGIFPKIRGGMHLAHPAVRRFSTPTFALETDKEWPIEVDGEYVGATPVSGRMMRAAIELRV